jgi:excisionase family DNA binding protein
MSPMPDFAALARLPAPVPQPLVQVPEPLWTSKEVSAYLRIGKNRPAVMARTGELPGIRIGRYLRFDPAVVRAYVEALRQNGQTPALSIGPLGRR